jgi:diguanylate cyclase (GGDEF)-like protein
MDGDHFNLLIVEDDLDRQQRLCGFLQSRSGIQIACASSVRQTIEKLYAQRFDIVLVAHPFGNEDGLSLVGRINEIAQADPPAIVLLPAAGDEDLAARAFKSGVADYLPHKRLQPATLIRAVESAAQKVAARRHREQQHRHLEYLADHDALTAILNRRAFMDRLLVEIARATRYSHPLCLLLIDLDRFKQTNDRYGHILGDAVLTNFAKDLRACVRAADQVGRIGGDEFAVLLGETDSRRAMISARKIYVRTHKKYPIPDSPSLQVTCSIGFAPLLPPAKSRDSNDTFRLRAQIYYQADRALYAAKAAGRNCIREFSPGLADPLDLSRCSIREICPRGRIDCNGVGREACHSDLEHASPDGSRCERCGDLV